MAFFTTWIDAVAPRDLTEVADGPAATAPPAPRLGYDSDVPWGGSSKMQPGGDYPDGRANFMTSLYTAYKGCPWLSSPIDVIARTITAGGVHIVPSPNAADTVSLDSPPPEVVALQALLDYCNPHQDIVQLLRGVVTDCGIYGDAFIEIVWLLGLPVAIYSLDPATMSVDADEHGSVSGYTQLLDTREVHFDPHQIIHISMDAPKGSLYGMGIAEKALLPVMIWLFTSATIKETMKRGDPPRIHVDFPLEMQDTDVRTWRGKYRQQNLGTANIGNPLTTRGGSTVKELQLGKLTEYLDIQVSCRDTILSVAGVPPAKVGVIESGNLGGGTGNTQDKTFARNTCGPIASIVLEKLNFTLGRAFGLVDWEIGFVDVDWRDDQAIEEIRDKRIRNGSWTLNDYLTDIGKPTIGPEGDVHVLITSREIITWDQVQRFADASVAAIVSKTTQAEATTQAQKDQAEAAKTAAANGHPPVPPGTPPPPHQPGAPGAPAGPPVPPGGAAPPGSDGKPAESVPPSWSARLGEHYRRLISAGVR